MAVTITQSPAYPTRKTTISFALSGGGNYLRLFLTDAPPGSDYRKRLDDSGASRIELFKGSSGQTFDFVDTKGGKYILAAQEYTQSVSTHGGGYSGDPLGYMTETKIGSETTVNVVFGTAVTQPIGVGSDTGTLRFWVWESTIRATSVALHGEKTPAIVDVASPKAQVAAGSSSVTSGLTALAGVTVSTALGTLSTVFEDIRDSFNDHLTQAGVHTVNDTDNEIGPAFSSPSGTGLPRACAELVRRMYLHMTNDASDGNGPGSGAYHKSPVVSDWVNLMIAPPPGDLAGVFACLGDAWRAYEAHRVATAVHTIADTTNTLAALPAILDIHSDFCAALASASPTAPATSKEGFVLIAHGAGMKEG